MHHLMNWLVILQPNWRQVGESLKVEDYQLESLRLQIVHDAVRLSTVFNEWKNSMCSPYTFEQLISSLEERGYERAIKKVKEKLQDKKVRKEYFL